MRFFHFVKMGLILSTVAFLGSMLTKGWTLQNAEDLYTRIFWQETAAPASGTPLIAPADAALLWDQVQEFPLRVAALAIGAWLMILLLIVLNPNVRQVQFGAWCVGGGAFLYWIANLSLLYPFFARHTAVTPTSVTSWIATPALLCYLLGVLLCLKSIVEYREEA